MPNPLNALPYLGGKSGGGFTGTGRWVASMLPNRTGYAETHGGMCGVLLQRRPAKVEYVNDLDGRIVNWWRVLRDEPEELLRRLGSTPIARSMFVEALACVDDPDPMVSAWAVSVVLHQSLRSSLDSDPSLWRRGVGSSHRPGGGASKYRTLNTDRLRRVSERMRDVRLECVGAVSMLDWLARYEDAVVYVDPPYRDRRIRYGTENVDDLTDALLAQRGFVAVSGYGDEWDHLGWRRFEHVTVTSAAGDLNATKRPERTEVLWTSQAPEPIEARLWDA